jgi:hypothetical protein
MKKIFILLTLIIVPLASIAQITGLGTWASPYKGTLTSNLTWSGNVYVGGDIIASAWKLTISPGANIIFVTDTADIRIQSTGQLYAKGNVAGGMIRFTANDDNDINFGETGERWGHISFQNMGSAGASLIDSCIIEYGDVSSTSLPNRYGGGIYTSFTNLTISNSVIRYNKAAFGGGIFVDKNVSPAIYNSTIHNNTSSSSGGGLYFWSGTASVITNCLVFSNISTSGGGGGGVFLGDLCGNVRFYNTTFANNSAGTNGKNIMLYVNTNPSRPSFKNCIIWSPINSIYYNSPQTPLPSDFVNCAILNPVAGSTTSCITLNSTNTDPAGPNFTSITDNYWNISPWSPCVNAGIDNSSDPLVPVTDKTGRPRIGQTDIGANESWGFFWVGDDITNPDVWNNSSNWYSNVTPSGDEDIFIPGGLVNYPTSNPSQTYTIHSGRSMILAPGAKATFGTLTNNGTLKLGSDASNISSLITGSYSGNPATVELFLSGGTAGTKLYRWHYISIPTSSLLVSTFTTATPDIVRYYDSRVTIDPTTGWVAQDGYIYATGSGGGPTFTTLYPGIGYNFWDNNDNTFTFSGQLNTADVAMTLDFAGGTNNGFNLLGNPFSSGLNWDYINTHRFPSQTSKSVYFTRNNSLCTYIAGVGTPGDVTGIIPPMQGFFTKTYATGKTIYLADSARTHNSIHPRYKGSGTIPLVRLSLSEDTTSDETVVRFDENAKSGLDNDFDAMKIFISLESTSIYTSLSGSQYAINGQPFPDPLIEIPVVVNLIGDSLHNISSIQLQGLDNYDVYLTDNITGFTADLKKNPVLTFSASPGLLTDRFVLKVGNMATRIENLPESKTIFNIYNGNNVINIQTMADEWDGRSGTVKVFDLTGRTFTELQNTEFRKNSVTQVRAPWLKGMYVVEINSGIQRYVGKVVIR